MENGYASTPRRLVSINNRVSFLAFFLAEMKMGMFQIHLVSNLGTITPAWLISKHLFTLDYELWQEQGTCSLPVCIPFLT